MATVESKKTSKKSEAKAADPANPSAAKSGRRRRFRLIFWMPLGLFFLLLGCARP